MHERDNDATFQSLRTTRQDAGQPDADEDRRWSPRKEVSLRVVLFSQGVVAGLGRIRDVGFRGMFVETENALPFGSAVTLSLVGVSEREVRIPAVVRWCKPNGIGVQFRLMGAYETYVLTELAKKNR